MQSRVDTEKKGLDCRRILHGFSSNITSQISDCYSGHSLLNIIQSNGFTINNLWPKEWAIGTQAILMVLIADFFRYWLHRLSHEWMPLWRLHAVHHSPHKLYSMNVGRFHPLEKSIQFVFDALPFIILGITENVLALYFVFTRLMVFFNIAT